MDNIIDGVDKSNLKYSIENYLTTKTQFNLINSTTGIPGMFNYNKTLTSSFVNLALPNDINHIKDYITLNENEINLFLNGQFSTINGSVDNGTFPFSNDTA